MKVFIIFLKQKFGTTEKKRFKLETLEKEVMQKDMGVYSLRT